MFESFLLVCLHGLGSVSDHMLVIKYSGELRSEGDVWNSRQITPDNHILMFCV